MFFVIFMTTIKYLTVYLTLSDEVLGGMVKIIGENRVKSIGVVAQLG